MPDARERIGMPIAVADGEARYYWTGRDAEFVRALLILMNDLPDVRVGRITLDFNEGQVAATLSRVYKPIKLGRGVAAS